MNISTLGHSGRCLLLPPSDRLLMCDVAVTLSLFRDTLARHLHRYNFFPLWSSFLFLRPMPYACPWRCQPSMLIVRPC